jgi:hypothetical protein
MNIAVGFETMFLEQGKETSPLVIVMKARLAVVATLNQMEAGARWVIAQWTGHFLSPLNR